MAMLSDIDWNGSSFAPSGQIIRHLPLKVSTLVQFQHHNPNSRTGESNKNLGRTSLFYEARMDRANVWLIDLDLF